MNDSDLLAFYLAKAHPDAQRWNLSAENLQIEWMLRHAIETQLTAADGMRACNIGIGVGEWDDFLGYWLEDHRGTLTSVDIDAEICETLRYRQERERHTNPARVLCEDALKLSLPPESFDLVTLVGSTLGEIDAYEPGLRACVALLAPRGTLLYSDFEDRHAAERFRALAPALGVGIVGSDQAATSGAYLFVARRR
jgi:SAM-dependent methyltransferase